ncbi:MAG: EamA family transporter [Clostridiales bacterium]|nr:EamA family transporter [Candidatus Blautia equi]
MFNYAWPIALVVLSNVVYQICAKSVPAEMNAFASLTVTYLVAALFSLVMFFAMGKDTNLTQEYSKLNWAPFLLGVVIVGLEIGLIFAYKVGWPVSIAVNVESAFLAVALIVVGKVVYQEPVTWNKVVGIAICMGGLALVNYK